MKKFISGVSGIIFCLFSTNAVSHAQEWKYLEEGTEWTVQTGYKPDVWCYTLSLSGELEKYGHTWKRSLMDQEEFLAYRQEGKKIWALYPYDDGTIDTVPFLMFDFGLEKGDTSLLYVDTIHHTDDAWVVESVFDSVFETGQEARRCLSVYLMNDPETKDVWAEGIGSLCNGLSYSPSGYLRSPSTLICVQKATGDIWYRRHGVCRLPKHLAYDYGVQRWSVLCGDTKDTYHTQWLYFKESEEQRWNQAYVAAKEDFSDERPCGLYYQDGLQVYFKEAEDGPVTLLYDFGLEKGERIGGRDKSSWAVDEVYYKEMDGLQRRCLQMVSDKGEADVWVEGLGSLNTGFLPSDFFGDTTKTELLCVQADVSWHSGGMYHNARFEACHIEKTVKNDIQAGHEAVVRYNVRQKILEIESEFQANALEVADASGRCVLRANHPGKSVSVARLPQGLYVYRLYGEGILCSGKFVR